MARRTPSLCVHSIHPSRWPASPGICRVCGRPNTLKADHAVEVEPAPAPSFSFSRSATAWRVREDEKALGRLHTGFFLQIGADGAERAFGVASTACKAFLQESTGPAARFGVRLVHRVWAGAENHKSKLSRLVSETVLQEVPPCAS